MILTELGNKGVGGGGGVRYLRYRGHCACLSLRGKSYERGLKTSRSDTHRAGQ